MALGTIFGVLGTAAKSLYDTTKKTTSNTTKDTNTPVVTTGNEHQDYINQNYSGGLTGYTQTQQDKYNNAVLSGDTAMIKKLADDAARVGYNLSAPVVNTQPAFNYEDLLASMPTMNTSGIDAQLNDLLSAIQTYKPQTLDIQYPDTSQYNFEGIQNQLQDLTENIQNYKGADYMSMDEATARANSQLSNLYNENLNQALEKYNKNAISRGMFGQLPTEALKQNAIAENELSKAGAINDLGSTLYGQDYDIAQQENANFYNRLNNEASLLGQQYNNELGQYKNTVNDYLNQYNMAKQQDTDFYNNLTQQLNIVKQQYGVESDEYQNAMNEYLSKIDISDNKRQNAIDTLSQYSNDYQARINEIKNNADASDDWEESYLNILRNQKIADQQAAQEQSALNWAKVNKTTSGSSGTSTKADTTPKIDAQELTSAARLLSNQLYPDGLYTQDQFQEVYDYLYTLWTTGKAPSYVPSRSTDTNAPTLLDKINEAGLLDGNNNSSTLEDYELFNWLNK